jgi:hypothetical protein
MNNGTAIFQGERIWFSSTLLNQWSGELEYLIAYQSESFWVKEHQISSVVFYIGQAAR